MMRIKQHGGYLVQLVASGLCTDGEAGSNPGQVDYYFLAGKNGTNFKGLCGIPRTGTVLIPSPGELLAQWKIMASLVKPHSGVGKKGLEQRSRLDKNQARRLIRKISNKARINQM